MKKSSVLALLTVLLPLVVEPACAPNEPSEDRVEEKTGTSRDALLGGSKLLWPMQDGKAKVRVCWLPLDLGGETLPGGDFAADLAQVLPERKQWVREGVEREWNGKTVVQFIGWEDCGVAEADIYIQPISTSGTTYCPTKGNANYCVETIGARGKGKRVFLNVLFGDEALGEARYVQTVTPQTLDNTKVLPNGVALPAICYPQMTTYVTHFVHNQPVTAEDIAGIQRVHEDCLQNVSNHEFGHLAGFSHEQNRKDVSAACAAQYAAVIPDDPSDEDSPLGTFEEDSIMSYCRTTLPGTLTDEDVAQTNAFYETSAPKLPGAMPQPAPTVSSGTSSSAAPATHEDPPIPAHAKRVQASAPSGGGCNAAGSN